MIEQEDNCAAMLDHNKSLGSADVILFSELTRVKKKKSLHSRLSWVAINSEKARKTCLIIFAKIYLTEITLQHSPLHANIKFPKRGQIALLVFTMHT